MKTLLFIVAFVVLCGSATNVQACSCEIPVGKSEEAQVRDGKRTAVAVFVGKLVKLTEPRNDDGTLTGSVIAEFEVERAWRGVKNSRITVYTTNVCCICGFPFQEGVRYIVYASGKDKLFTTICTRTRPLGEEQESSDEKYLGSPVIFVKNRNSLEPIS